MLKLLEEGSMSRKAYNYSLFYFTFREWNLKQVLSLECQIDCFTLQDETFQSCLKDDKSTKHWLAQLLKNIEAMSSQGGAQTAGQTAPAHKPGQAKLSQPPGV